MEEISKELKDVKDHFEKNTGIKVQKTIEERNYFHWKRLVFEKLECDDLIKIGNYLKKYFHEDNYYYEYSISLHEYCGMMTLTIDERLIKKFIIDKPNNQPNVPDYQFEEYIGGGMKENLLRFKN
jgi:hypothetical protein